MFFECDYESYVCISHITEWVIPEEIKYLGTHSISGQDDIVVTYQYTLLYILCVFHEESDTKEKFVIKNHFNAQKSII